MGGFAEHGGVNGLGAVAKKALDGGDENAWIAKGGRKKALPSAGAIMACRQFGQKAAGKFRGERGLSHG